MTATASPRWEYYNLMRGDRVRSFWEEHLGQRERAVLLVVGRGFDPRMCLGPAMVLAAGGLGVRDVLALQFLEGSMSPSQEHEPDAKANWEKLVSLLDGRGTVTSQNIEFWSEGRRVSSQNARDLFGSPESIQRYSDVIVDISAMPRSVYFPLLARLLYFLDNEAALSAVNLHILVAEDPDLDTGIVELGIDEKAEFMASFVGGFDEESTQTPKVWIPLMGEHRNTQFDRIRDRVKPDEVCPVLPSPSRNPRRGDEIVRQFQQVLFDDLRLDPRGFLYASELNPFEVYRQLRAAVLHYDRVFRLLGGCRVALSALSSKLMSLGALLAAYELKELEYDIGVAHIECQGHGLTSSIVNPELVGLWLKGECDVT